MNFPGVLFINRNDSACGTCGKAADMREKSHQTQLGFDGPKKGCGETYTILSSEYDGMDEQVQALRPDLPWFDFFTLMREAQRPNPLVWEGDYS